MPTHRSIRRINFQFTFFVLGRWYSRNSMVQPLYASCYRYQRFIYRNITAWSASESIEYFGFFNRLLKKCFRWFDKLTTNGKKTIYSIFTPFALSLSKGERSVFQQPVKADLRGIFG
jgi:hypothetical protein